MSDLLVPGKGVATSGVLLRRAAPVTGSDKSDVIVTPVAVSAPGTLGQVPGTTADVRVSTLTADIEAEWGMRVRAATRIHRCARLTLSQPGKSGSSRGRRNGRASRTASADGRKHRAGSTSPVVSHQV